MSATTDFKPGDVVRLRSGGPAMTVTVIFRSRTVFACRWFDAAGHMNEARFAGELLSPSCPDRGPLEESDRIADFAESSQE